VVQSPSRKDVAAFQAADARSVEASEKLTERPPSGSGETLVAERLLVIPEPDGRAPNDLAELCAPDVSYAVHQDFGPKLLDVIIGRRIEDGAMRGYGYKVQISKLPLRAR
jgi:hypothetical protein